MAGRAVVVEVNEIPLRVIDGAVRRGRAPFFKSLKDSQHLTETVITESLDRELYPSQTWASVGTGVPYSQHGIWWYNDPKPVEYPFYWQRVAASRSVGLVNVLHSSPVATQCGAGDYRFVIPDCFASEPTTVPNRFEAFQRLNLELTARNTRQSNLSLDRSQVKSVLDAVRQLPLRPTTAAKLTRMVGMVVAGKVPKERLRSAQFLVLSDLFLALLNEEAPDLAVFFTNHVAAAMHRYWYAMFPDDFTSSHYDASWIRRHGDEIVFAVELADLFLTDVARWCELNNRALIVVSSMGQGPSDRLDTSRGLEAVVRDPNRFLSAVGVVEPYEVLAAMTPNLTLRFPSASAAVKAAGTLEGLVTSSTDSVVDVSGSVVNFTYDLDVVDPQTVSLGRSVGRTEDIGVELLQVDDHSSGRHTAKGILGVYNSGVFEGSGCQPIDVFEIAPAILALLGVDAAPEHVSPSFRL